MEPAVTSSINAFCLLPRSYEAHLSFYTDVLGLRAKRVEESFVAFDARGVVPCLWEVGHICRHLGYREPTATDYAAIAMLDLAMPGAAALHVAMEAARTGGHRMVPLDGEAAGFLVRDPNSHWWRVTGSDATGSDATETAPMIGGMTLLVRDIAASTRFYDRMGFTRQPGAATVYRAGNGVTLELLAEASFAAERDLRLPRADGPTAMPAIGCASFAELESKVAALTAKGLTIDVAPRMHVWGFQAAYLSDPDQNIWEIYATERDDV